MSKTEDFCFTEVSKQRVYCRLYFTSKPLFYRWVLCSICTAKIPIRWLKESVMFSIKVNSRTSWMTAGPAARLDFATFSKQSKLQSIFIWLARIIKESGPEAFTPPLALSKTHYCLVYWFNPLKTMRIYLHGNKLKFLFLNNVFTAQSYILNDIFINSC